MLVISKEANGGGQLARTCNPRLLARPDCMTTANERSRHDQEWRNPSMQCWSVASRSISSFKLNFTKLVLVRTCCTSEQTFSGDPADLACWESVSELHC